MENNKQNIKVVDGDAVDHPSYYNGRADGIECIEIVRHYVFDIGCAIKYLWRSGLKHSAGKSDREKEIEDLKKAIWYIKDYIGNERAGDAVGVVGILVGDMVKSATGYDIKQIISEYKPDIAEALTDLLAVGFIINGQTCRFFQWESLLNEAIKHIEGRICELSKSQDADPSN